MSKGSLFWANARGKLGESVYYRAGGEQRNRTYVKNIKNPRTLAQAKNRITLMNYVAGFRSLRPILANSFVSRKSSQSGFNAFVSANKNPNSPAVDKYAAENLGYSVPKEGSNLWIDSWFIPKTCKNEEAAMQFIDYVCREDVGMANFDYVYYASPLTPVVEALDEEIRSNEAIIPSKESLENCEVFTSIDSETAALLNHLWQELKSRTVN